MGDLLTSLVKVFVDLVTYIAGNDVNLGIVAMLSAVPLLIRLIQNLVLFRLSGERFPYLSNALKYAAAEVVVMFGTFHATRFNGDGDHDADDPDKLTSYRFIFIFFSAVSTLYTYAWDVRMDWRLQEKSEFTTTFRDICFVLSGQNEKRDHEDKIRLVLDRHAHFSQLPE